MWNVVTFQNDFGHTWPFLVLAKLGLAKLGLARCSSLARRWFDSQVRPSLDNAFRHRVVGSASSLSVVHFPLSTLAVGVGPDSRVYRRSTSPTHARLWGLARGHDPCPGGRSARHNHLPLGCPCCVDSVGDLFHCLCVCPAFDDLRAQWCQRSGVPVQSALEW